MKTAVLCGIALVVATASAAQVIANPPRTMTLTGCVAGGAKARPITLTNALMLPAESAAPPAATGTDTGSPPAGGVTPAPTPPPTTPRAVGTSGTIAGTAPAGSSSSSVGGYRLSGVDMTSWVGRRVQIVGTLVSSPTASSSVPADTASAPDKAFVAMPEFRVTSVQPITGPCPQR